MYSFASPWTVPFSNGDILARGRRGGKPRHRDGASAASPAGESRENHEQTAPPEVAIPNLTAASGKLSCATTSGIELLLAELMTISFKYAYPAGQRGSVNVDFSRPPKAWRLEVSDEGRNLPAGFDMEGATGFGIQVIKAFVQRLDANVIFSSRQSHTV